MGEPAGVHDQRDAGPGAPVEQVDAVLLVPREGDEVGHVVEPAPEVAHDVAERLAVRVRGPGRRIGRAHGRQRDRRPDPRRGDAEPGRVGRCVVGEVVAGHECRRALDERRGLGAGDGVLDVAPAPPRAAHQHPDTK